MQNFSIHRVWFSPRRRSYTLLFFMMPTWRAPISDQSPLWSTCATWACAAGQSLTVRLAYAFHSDLLSRFSVEVMKYVTTLYSLTRLVVSCGARKRPNLKQLEQLAVLTGLRSLKLARFTYTKIFLSVCMYVVCVCACVCAVFVHKSYNSHTRLVQRTYNTTSR